MGEFIEVARTDELNKVKTILGKAWQGEFLLLESPGKNNWRRLSYG
jgi:hypothetical protein